MYDQFLYKLGIIDFCFDAIIGIHSHEREAAQPLEANISVDIVLDKLEDEIDSTFNYSLIPKIILEEAQKKSHLIEILAENIAKRLLLENQKIRQVEIEIRKPKAVPRAKASFVKITRGQEILNIS